MIPHWFILPCIPSTPRKRPIEKSEFEVKFMVKYSFQM